MYVFSSTCSYTVYHMYNINFILSIYIYMYIYIHSVVAELIFNQSTYSIGESDGTVQFTLVLSIPSSFDINVGVLSFNALASGE